MIGGDNLNAQVECRASITTENATSNNANHSSSVEGSQVDVQILERNITGRIRNQVDNVVATVETRVHEAILSALESLVNQKVDLAIKLVNLSSRRDPESFLLDPDRKDFSRNFEGLQLTASSRKNRNADLNRINEIRGNISVEVIELSVNERNFDRKHTLITLGYKKN